jgi:hypothetical protein
VSAVCGGRFPFRWLSNSVQPAELVLDLALLNTLESGQELDASRSRLVRFVAVRNLVTLGGTSDRLDGNKSSRSTSSKNFIESAELLVRDLSSVSESTNAYQRCRHTSRDSISHPKDSPILRMLSPVTLLPHVLNYV